MTTSYPLSLRLKELGVEQSNGEYYWVKLYNGQIVRCHYTQLQGPALQEALCRALTLGEVVRMLNYLELWTHDGSAWFAGDDIVHPLKSTTPEEAAGELLAAIKEQEKQTS